MKKHYLFHTKNTSTLQEALEEATLLGLDDIYTIEEMGLSSYTLGGYSRECIDTNLHHLIRAFCDQTINWQKQSELFSPFYKEGKIQVPLSAFSSSEKVLLLHTGAGFGDLSHPTTELTLRLMAERVCDKKVLDIGCGNGVLSLAAILLNAHYVYGIDIDAGAIEHAMQNLKLNELERVEFFLDHKELPAPSVIDIALMNMTFLEQRQALSSLKTTLQSIPWMITSGILDEQNESYLDFMQSLGWNLCERVSKENWLAYCFKK